MTLTRNAQNGLFTGSTLGSITDTMNYNGFGETSDYNAAYNGTSLYNVQHTRDKLGRITQKIETIEGITDTYNYTYDTVGRLTEVRKNSVIITSYTYDTNGNRLTHTDSGGVTVNGSYDDQDRLLQYGGATYTYTANGELLSKTSGGQTTTYQYDAMGNLVSVDLPDGTRIEYVIDGRNRCVGKRINGVTAQGFLYQNALKPIAELNGSNTVVSRFVYATHPNVPDYLVKGGVTYRILTDHLGSPRLVVNTTSGVIEQRMDYDAFGNVTNDTNPGFQPFGFGGGIYDTHTKLVRFGARDYDADTGRWTAKDPSRFDGGTNLFGYSFNDPVNYFDQNGQTPAIAAAGAAAGGGGLLILQAAALTGIGWIAVDCVFNECNGVKDVGNAIEDLIDDLIMSIEDAPTIPDVYAPTEWEGEREPGIGTPQPVVPKLPPLPVFPDPPEGGYTDNPPSGCDPK